MKVNNPILKGFNPDPSICKVGGDFFIATSTFEWFPGVLIHHSKDLKNWKLTSRPLERLSQLNMLGNPNSGGIWAPALSFFNDCFWLIYTDIKVPSHSFKDGHNYLVTLPLNGREPAKAIADNDWSEPIYLNSSGFDPSLFHDDDGRQYIVNMVWDHRAKNHSFYGISIQQYSNFRERLVGRPEVIFKGTEYGLTEAPHLYKRGEYYYLLTAEGGTGYGHMATIARSKNLYGPYEIYEKPLITSRFYPQNPIQKAGHASLAKLTEDEWVIVYLCGRPIKGDGKYVDKYMEFADGNPNGVYCPLGRETSIAKVHWKDGWPFVSGEQGNQPPEGIETTLPEHKFEPEIIKDDFDSKKLNINFQTLRIPLDNSILNLEERDSHLRLYGRESLASTFVQAHIARRWQSLNFEAETKIEFHPWNFQQMAGLSMYYNTENWVSFYITYDERIGKRVLDISVMDNKAYSQALDTPIILPDEGIVYLRAKVLGENYNFYYSTDGKNFEKIALDFPSYKLSDDYVVGAGFTGAFVGLFCIDGTFSGNPTKLFAAGHQDELGPVSWLKDHENPMPPKVYADFDYFSYEELD